jgi:hypothetical protein
MVWMINHFKTALKPYGNGSKGFSGNVPSCWVWGETDKSE